MINFGTDGWRALIAQDYTFENVAKCTQGVAEYIKKEDSLPQSVVVGYDTRFLSREFALVARNVLVNNGIKVYWIDGPTPTPVITYMITNCNAGGAIIITASHNPYDWNGFKFKSHKASSATQDIIDKIEKYANSVSPLMDNESDLNPGLVECVPAKQSYFDHMDNVVDLSLIKRSKINVIVDCMYGAGMNYLMPLLNGPNIQISELHGKVNPNFPGIGHPEPIEQNLQEVMNAICSDDSIDIGLAFDGDADRIGLIDENGNYVSTLDSFALIAYYFLSYKKHEGPIIKSITHSDMINKLCQIYCVDVHETPVGFKNLGPRMIDTDAILAGEESGGFAFRDSIAERDGILSALYILEFIALTGKSCSQLLQELYQIVGTHIYSRRDITLNEEERNRIQAFDSTDIPIQNCPMQITHVNLIDGVKLICDEGWVAYRLSGTEPLLRIYSESNDQQCVDSLMDYVQAFLGV